MAPHTILVENLQPSVGEWLAHGWRINRFWQRSNRLERLDDRFVTETVGGFTVGGRSIAYHIDTCSVMVPRNDTLRKLGGIEVFTDIYSRCIAIVK